MVDAYPLALRQLALATPDEAAAAALSPLPGVYAQVPGPQLETPAEIAVLRTLGADVVGMSMALETVAARHGEADVLGLALVTNGAATPTASTELQAIAEVGAGAGPAVAAIVNHVVGSFS
jgi:purine-nucleoside phosphorylase